MNKEIRAKISQASTEIGLSEMETGAYVGVNLESIIKEIG